MRCLFIVLLLLAGASRSPAQALIPMQTLGVTVRSSPYAVQETVNRLQATLLRNGATIYARIDQQAELRAVGLQVLPLEFLLFGNPRTGGPLIAVNPVLALDLPLKVIAWQDALQRVWVAYNQVSYLQNRYELSSTLTPALDLTVVLDEVLAP